MPPEIAALLAALPKWSTSLAVDAGYGYKDNVLLSPVGEERSAFARGNVEFFLLRVPRDRFDYSLYVQAEGTHYFSSRSVDNEARGWLATEFGYRPGDTLKFALPITGYYSDRVLDVSDTEAERLIAELKETGVFVGPSVRWTPHPSWWLEAQAVGQRRYYEDRANDGRVGEGSLRLAWLPHERIELRLTGSRRRRDFVDRAQYSAAGRELVGTALKIAEREGEMRVEVKWDALARWRTITQASVMEYRDNGSGYFSYREKKIRQELEWKSEKWSITAGGVARRVDFAVQTVGFGINLPARLRDEFSAELHVERKLTSRWTIFGGYTWERSRSNDPLASYAANEGLLGMRWSWEK